MSMIGKTVEPFSAQAYHNEKFIEVTQDDFRDQWTILCFYPADFTFVCPTELEDLQEQSAALGELGAKIYSVSSDSHFVHKAWHDHSQAISKIEYPMIADPAKHLINMFDVLDPSGVAQRGTFIIDPDGVVQVCEIHAEGIGRTASTLVDKLRAAKYVRENPGQVCPAKWKETGETLTPGLDLVGKI